MRPRFLLIPDRSPSFPEEWLKEHLPFCRTTSLGRLFTAGNCPVLELPAIDGWLIGSLFTADGGTRRRELASSSQLAIMSTRGRSIVEQASGAYVAIWRDSGSGKLMALRDPSACLPAFAARFGERFAIASDVACFQWAGLKLEIDVDGVAQHLRYPLVPSERTALTGVTELTSGAVTSFTDRIESDILWYPASFARERRTDAPAIAQAIDAVVSGQASEARRIGIELSGGLDSSIVAAALPDPRNVLSLHLVPAAQDGDERRYARAVTDRFDMPTTEIAIGFGDVDILAQPKRITARPIGVAHFGAIDAKLQNAANAADLDAIFSGAGGDSVFCSLSSTGPVLDAWRDGGTALARTVLSEVASLSGVNLWEAGRHVAKRLLSNPWRRWRWPADDSLLGPIGRAAPPPDTRRMANLRPGSRAHVASILRMQALLDTHERMAASQMKFPLMAQPVLEACIATSSWRWMSGGRDRSVAREAYAGRVPAVVLDRSGKGRYDSLLVRAYNEQRAAIRELLLDGWLCRQGLVDRAAVETALKISVAATTTVHSRIIMLVDSELWCRMINDLQRIAGT